MRNSSTLFRARPIRRVLTTNTIAFLLSFAGSAQESWAGATQSHQNPPANLKKLSLEQLGNVEVTTASKEPEQVWRTPAAIYVITQEDIQRSGATSIAEVLRLAPGLQVARTDADHWAVGVRGFGGQFSKSLLVLIDGRSVYSPLFAGVYWQVQDTLLEDIERIEVIRGPGGTIWGANAVNGIINIDVQLGHEDGLSLAAWMRQQPNLCRIPVIAVTAHALVTEQQHFLQAGCNACVSKPVNFKMLSEELQRWLALLGELPSTR